MTLLLTSLWYGSLPASLNPSSGKQTTTCLLLPSSLSFYSAKIHSFLLQQADKVAAKICWKGATKLCQDNLSTKGFVSYLNYLISTNHLILVLSWSEKRQFPFVSSKSNVIKFRIFGFWTKYWTKIGRQDQHYVYEIIEIGYNAFSCSRQYRTRPILLSTRSPSSFKVTICSFFSNNNIQ